MTDDGRSIEETDFYINTYHQSLEERLWEEAEDEIQVYCLSERESDGVIIQ